MTEKHTRTNLRGRIAVLGLSLGFLSIGTAAATAQQRSYPVPGASTFPSAPGLRLPVTPTPTPITPNGAVVEDVIARVNDQIITRSEYERAEQGLLQDAQQQNVPAAEFQDKLSNLLRDMIDQQLLLSKGKELGITGDAETIRQLDEIRKQNHLDSMEALEKAATQQGVSFEDFKRQIRDRAVTGQVVREEVGRSLRMTHAEEVAYYNAHQKEFEQPEQVHLSEILVPTPENATDAQVAEAQAKADALAAKIKGGDKFAYVAKASSGGPTASAGGELGDFKRGALGTVLENATFSLPAGGVTAPIRTRQGFVILRVDSHQQAAVQPLSAVEGEVQNALYADQMQPALRAYLTKARQDAYVDIKPGFVDTGSNRRESKPAFTAYAPPPVKKKIVNKQKAEKERAAKAQAELAAARLKVADKQQAKAAADAQKAGATNVSAPTKRKKIRKEKIRYGQAPRTSLPAGTAIAEADATSAAPAGQAAGVAMAPTDTVTSISTGTGVDADVADPFAPKGGPEKKTRYSSREVQAEVDKANSKLSKAEVKATTRPIAATPTQTATEKVQAAPLGLNGDTVKKTKAKRKKGDPKERLQEKPKPDTTPVPVAPTVNPVLSGDVPATKPTQPSSDTTTLPSVNQGAPGATPSGQPIPATTSAEPNQPAVTPTPH
jgi:peptidyl-prolyl cis-trans isomerase SurA